MLRLLRSVVLVLVLVAYANAALAKDAGFFFVQIADTQLGFASNNADLTPEIDNFRKAVEHVNRLRPAFVIISGDLINKPHDPRQIREFMKVASEIRPDIPLHLVAGNHDIGRASAEGVQSYRRLFGEDYYSFECGGSVFVALDSCLIHDADSDARLRAKQRTWFAGELAKAKGSNAAHVFVCTHHPWFLAAPDEKDQYFNIPLAQRQDYLGLMRRYGVDFALAGHLHQESVARDSGLEMITTASVGKPLGKEPVGLRVFRVYKDHVEHAYYALDKVPERVEMGN